jgi:hypothetical protein
MRDRGPRIPYALELTEEFSLWALREMKWVQDVLADLDGGIGADLADMKLRQSRYSSYLARLGELRAIAEAYLMVEKGAITEMLRADGVTNPSQLKNLTEAGTVQQYRVFKVTQKAAESCNSLLMSIGNRLNHEEKVSYGHEKPPF